MRVAAALLTLYVVWGSTYLAIHWIVVAGWPLMTTASVRFFLASLLFLATARARGPLAAPAAFRTELVHAAVAATFLFVISNSLVMWGQTRVPSGLAALLVAMTPVWITLLEALGGRRPGRWQLAGVAVGLVGVAVLAEPLGGGGAVDPRGATALVGASVSWALGTVWSKRRRSVASPIEAAGWQLLFASAALFVLSRLRGEPLPATGSPRAFAAFAWLLVGGSYVGFGAFSWLLRNTPPSVATTYAYVNPVVAALLGWAFAGETFGLRSAVASTLVLSGVFAITAGQERRTTL